MRSEVSSPSVHSVAMVIPYVVVGNPNELAIVSGVGYSQPKFLNDGFAVVVTCFHKVKGEQ